MTEWKPVGPWMVGSGKFAGKALEQLMFSNYTRLIYQLGKMDRASASEKSLYHRHLEWLIDRGENLVAKKTCRFCGQKPISLFSVRSSHGGEKSFGIGYTCCDDEICKRQLEAEAMKSVVFLPIAFSQFLQFPRGYDRKQLERLLRFAYEVKGNLTAVKAFSVFAEEPVEVPPPLAEQLLPPRPPLKLQQYELVLG